MGQIFNSFIAGNQAGREEGEQRRRQNALEEAGQAYTSGNPEGAENALMAAGLVNEAGAYSTLAEARRNRTNRTAISGAMTNLDPNVTPQQRAEAGANAALGVGDTEQWAQFTQYANTLTQQDRENQAQRAQFLGTTAASLLGLPQEQRLERARAAVANSPYQNDPHIQALIDDDATDLSDAALTSAAQSSMGAADILAGRERQERYAVEDDRFGQQMALQRRGLEIQARNSAPDNQRPLPPAALATARSSMAAATRLRTSYDAFLEMLRNASPQALAGVGPDAAALQSAHRLLAIQAKSPAALDLGALVGADFNILNDILGEPGNIRQLVQQGGREGAIRRLEPFDQFLDAGADGLRQTYQPWSAQMPEFYQETAPAPDAPTTDAPPSRAPTSFWSLSPANRQTAIQRVRNGEATIEDLQQSFGLSPEEARQLVEQRRTAPSVVEGRGGARRPLY